MSEEKSTALTEASMREQLPAHLRESTERLGITTELRSAIIPPRLVLVQKQSPNSLVKEHGAGSLVVMPGDICLAKEGVKAHIIPVFFWKEFLKWAPYSMKGKMQSVLERTYDPTSELAAICRDPNRRASIECPEAVAIKAKDPVYSYQEHLNFLFVVPDQLNLRFVGSFSRTAWMAGSQLCGLIEAKHQDIFAAKYAIYSKEETRNGNEFFSPVFENAGWVDAQLHEALKKVYREVEQQFKERLIDVDYEADYSKDEDTKDHSANVIDGAVVPNTEGEY